MDALQREVIEDIRGNPGQTASQLWVKYADRLERSETVRILGAAIEKGILTRKMEKIRDGLHGPVMAHRYYPGLDVRELRRLVVTRRAGEAVHFDVDGTSVSVGVVEIIHNKVKLGFLADDRVKIHRMELLNGN